MTRWCWSTDGEVYLGDCATEDEAYQEGLKEAADETSIDHRELEPGDTMHVAHRCQVDATSLVNFSADSIIEQARDAAQELAGEVTDYWLDDVKDEAAEELNKAIGTAFAKWVEKHEPINFWAIDNIIDRVISEEDLAKVRALLEVAS